MRYPIPCLTLTASLLLLSGCQDQRPSPLAPDAVRTDAARFADYDVQIIDVDLPNALGLSASARGINARGDVVGTYAAQYGELQVARGYLLSNGEFKPVNPPDADVTWPCAINGRGDIVGHWRKIGEPLHGFLLRDGAYTNIDYPGAVWTRIWNIGPTGVIVGEWSDQGGKWHGFILEGGVFTSFDAPGDDVLGTYPRGLTPQGDVTGYATAPAPVYYRPFIRRADGSFLTDFEPPEPGAPFWFTHVNSRGDIAGGYYSLTAGRYMGFVRDKLGAYTDIEVPGLQHNELYSINASGVVVGTAWSPNTAFIAVPRNPDEL